MSKSRLWLLAHQDDEVLGLHLLSDKLSNIVVYLTDGVRLGTNCAGVTRVREAQMAWNKIDSNAKLIFFGTENSLADGMLGDNIHNLHFKELISICQEHYVDEIVTLQLEGGHQDHDITSLLAEEITKRLSLKAIFFPAYRATHTRIPFYCVMSSNLINSAETKFSKESRIQSARLAFSLMKNYKSQRLTWIGLGPFVIIKYLLGKPKYLISNASQEFRQEFPKKILYANRKVRVSIDYQNFRKKISSW